MAKSCCSCWYLKRNERQEPCRSCGTGFTNYLAHSDGLKQPSPRIEQKSLITG